MPRKAPDGKGVTEHRITLGDYERKLITKQLNEDDTLNKARTYSQVGKSIAIGGAVVGGTIAAATLGTLALAAYREAAGLVDQAQDLKSTAWTYLKFRVGAASFDDVVAEAQDYRDNQEERDAKDEMRKNMGILEYGLDRILVFLLGEDKQWTQTTLVTEDEVQQQQQQTPAQLEQTRFQAIYAMLGSPEAHIAWLNTKMEWDRAVDQFCLLDSPDYDAELCKEVTQDRQDWIRSSAWPTYPYIPGFDL